jgi:amino acid permease
MQGRRGDFICRLRRRYRRIWQSSGLAQGTLLTTYCYWGYYNICFLGGEVRRPEKTIPRAILLSVLFVAAFYVTMNLAVLPSLRDAAAHVAESVLVRVRLVAEIAHSAFGAWAGYLMAALIIWTAFASVFSLLLGYSRVPYAAARDGNYFSYLAAVHPKHHIPHRSLVALGVVGAAFCFFSLAQVITMLVITRILAAVLSAAGGRDAAAGAAAGVGAAVQDSAVSAAAAGGDRGILVHSAESDSRTGRVGCRGGHRRFGDGDLYGFSSR